MCVSGKHWHLAFGKSFDRVRQMRWSTSSCLVPDLHLTLPTTNVTSCLAPAVPPNEINETFHFYAVHLLRFFSLFLAYTLV